jgi:hypothetical protein
VWTPAWCGLPPSPTPPHPTTPHVTVVHTHRPLPCFPFALSAPVSPVPSVVMLSVARATQMVFFLDTVMLWCCARWQGALALLDDVTSDAAKDAWELQSKLVGVGPGVWGVDVGGGGR